MNNSERNKTVKALLAAADALTVDPRGAKIGAAKRKNQEGAYSEYAPAQEFAMKLKSKGVAKNIRLDKKGGKHVVSWNDPVSGSMRPFGKTPAISAGRSKYDDPEFATWIYKYLKKDRDDLFQSMKRHGRDTSLYDPAMVFIGPLIYGVEDAFQKEHGMSNHDYYKSEYAKKLNRNLAVAYDKLYGRGTFKMAVQNNKKNTRR